MDENETTTQEATETAGTAATGETAADAPAVAEESVSGDGSEEKKEPEQTPEQKEAERVEKERSAVKARQFAALQQKERKLHAADKQLKEQQAQVDAAKREVQIYYEEVQKQKTELLAKRKEVEDYREHLVAAAKFAKEDPIEFLRQLGITPEEYAARVQGGKPTSDFKLREETERLNKSWESKYSQLEKELQDQKEWRSRLEEERKEYAKQQEARRLEQQKAAEEAAAMEAFEQSKAILFSELKDNASKYPDLVIYDPNFVLSQAAELASNLGPESANVSIQELLSELQAAVAASHRAIDEKRAKVSASAPQVPDAAKPETANSMLDEAKRVRERRDGSKQHVKVRTISNDQSVRVSVPEPEEDREARIRRLLAADKS